MKFACVLLPELLFEKTCIYFVKSWNLCFFIDLTIGIHLKPCFGILFHVLVMFRIISDDFGKFWKFSFSGPLGVKFWCQDLKIYVLELLNLQFECRKISITIISKLNILLFLKIRSKYFLRSQIFDKNLLGLQALLRPNIDVVCDK